LTTLGGVIGAPKLALTISPPHLDDDRALLERQRECVEADGRQRHWRERRELVNLMLAGPTPPSPHGAATTPVPAIQDATQVAAGEAVRVDLVEQERRAHRLDEAEEGGRGDSVESSSMTA
jgi:hypothetical protein